MTKVAMLSQKDRVRAHIAETWSYLHGDVFVQLLTLTEGCYASGAPSVAAVMALFLDDGTMLSRLRCAGLRGSNVQDVKDHIAKHLGCLDSWDAEILVESCAALVPSPGAAIAVPELLGIIVLRSASRLPLAPVMAVLGREECLDRIAHALTVFRLAETIG